jgi:hypothetical protein
VQSHLVAGSHEFAELTVSPGHEFAHHEERRFGTSFVQHLE